MPSVLDALRAYADQVKEAYDVPVADGAWEEEQLKRPVEMLIRDIGAALGFSKTLPRPESPVEGIGRPDFGVFVDKLLAGHVELKKPGTGANAPRYKGRNLAQWKKFSDLPNLIYTDGLEFSYFHGKVRVGDIIKLDGDPRDLGAAAVTEGNATVIEGVFRQFLGWEPQVPTRPKALAEALAPICGFLRDDVAEALKDPDSPLTHLAHDWRKVFFPDATDQEFADAYAQTLTYALLLARFSGATDLSTDDAADALRSGHALLSEALRVLGHSRARKALGSTIDLLERIVGAVRLSVFDKQGSLIDDGPAHAMDPWLYFYEDFLAAYDPKMRNDRGVYYTPWQVVQAQVRLTAQLLDRDFEKPYGAASEGVVTLDPACGTGTYVLAAVRHGLDAVAARGKSVSQAATRAAAGVHAFEILVGPYAVAHLRLTQQVKAAGGRLPDDGAHVYLTDTLEDPGAEPRVQDAAYGLRELAEEHLRAQKVKAGAPVLLCIGNPPYDREQAEAGQSIEQRKGGWVRHGHVTEKAGKTTPELRSRPILADFLDPLALTGDGVHAKNLYNDYVYFWRWALWKTVGPQSGSDGGIVSFITAKSYLRGPGFKGMRRAMREAFDDLWILDLGGDNLGARRSDNVFAIQTPVCIATGVRYRDGHAKRTADDEPARVHFARIEGTEAEKLDVLRRIQDFGDVEWTNCPTGWDAPFLPAQAEAFAGYPALENIFPWQENGVQFKRSWPIGETDDVLQARWGRLTAGSDRAIQMKESGARTVLKSGSSFDDPNATLPAIATLSRNAGAVESEPYGYRSFDRQRMLPDTRICDRHRPVLQTAYGDSQIHLVGFLSEVVGEGPMAVATDLIPDLHHFRGSFGGKHIVPLWRDPAGTDANVTRGVLERLGEAYGAVPSPEDLFAYAFALLAAPAYVETFWDALETPGPRVPITTDAGLFAEVAALGRDLIWLHTYGERFVPKGTRAGSAGLPRGASTVRRDTPQDPARYPDEWAYNSETRELRIGQGAESGLFTDVPPSVEAFTISGFAPLKSWLEYRMKSGAGKKSSPLDDIRPQTWSFDDELLDLLWVLEAVLSRHPAADALLERVIAGETIPGSAFPKPTKAEQKGPAGVKASDETTPLFADANLANPDTAA